MWNLRDQAIKSVKTSSGNFVAGLDLTLPPPTMRRKVMRFQLLGPLYAAGVGIIIKLLE